MGCGPFPLGAGSRAATKRMRRAQAGMDSMDTMDRMDGSANAQWRAGFLAFDFCFLLFFAGGTPVAHCQPQVPIPFIPVFISPRKWGARESGRRGRRDGPAPALPHAACPMPHALPPRSGRIPHNQ